MYKEYSIGSYGEMLERQLRDKEEELLRLRLELVELRRTVGELKQRLGLR